MSSSVSPVAGTRHPTDSHESHFKERMALRLIAVCTYGLFLLAAIYGRIGHAQYQSRTYTETRSIWREAWDSACSTLAFAFNRA